MIETIKNQAALAAKELCEVAKLEKGECSLEESISLFEQGIKHTENCREALDKAKNRILQLTEVQSEEQNLD